MKIAVRIGMCLGLALMVAMPLMADDAEKKAKKERKKPDPAARILKTLEKAELTEEQVAKVKEISAAHAAKLAEARKQGGGVRAEAIKKAKADGLSGKELREAVAKALKDNPDKAGQAALKGAQKKYREAINAVLTAQQKEKLGQGRKRKKPAGEKKPGEKKPKAKKPEAKKGGEAKKKEGEKKAEAKKDE